MVQQLPLDAGSSCWLRVLLTASSVPLHPAPAPDWKEPELEGALSLSPREANMPWGVESGRGEGGGGAAVGR